MLLTRRVLQVWNDSSSSSVCSCLYVQQKLTRSDHIRDPRTTKIAIEEHWRRERIRDLESSELLSHINPSEKISRGFEVMSIWMQRSIITSSKESLRIDILTYRGDRLQTQRTGKNTEKQTSCIFSMGNSKHNVLYVHIVCC